MSVATEVRHDAGQYRLIGRYFASHGMTAHTKGNYVSRENPVIHTQTVEGSFSIFKRGMKGRLSALRRKAFTPLSGRI